VNFHHVVLVGLSGSGKSTIGPRLARRLDLLFIDTDKTVVARAGCPIDEIFATRGEATFRAFEREAVREAIAGPRSVIATGGGAPVDPENFRQLWEGNAVIWLDAPMEVLISRMEGSQRGVAKSVRFWQTVVQGFDCPRFWRRAHPSTRRHMSGSRPG